MRFLARPAARTLCIATLLAASLAGCDEATDAAGELAADDDAIVAEGASAIVAGTVDEGHPAVVALTYHGDAFCSGTLVAPTVVLTAAHCLHEDFVGALSLPDVAVFFGTDVAGAGTSIRVTATHLHPDFDSRGSQEDDVAVVRLAFEAPVEPLALGAAPEKGSPIRLVGFGRVDPDVETDGVKRVGAATIQAVTPRSFVLRPSPHGTCMGDSGGAAIATVDGHDVLVGVHTRSDCRTGMIDERVDAHLASFLAPYVGAAACLDCAGDGRGGDLGPADDDREGAGGTDADDDDARGDDTSDEAIAAATAGCAVRPATTTGGAAAGLLPLAAVLVAALRRRGQASATTS